MADGRPAQTPPGTRYGGRTKGTPNKSKDEARRLIEEACPGWNPLQAMAKVAQTGYFEVYDPKTGQPALAEDGAVKTVLVSDKTRATMLKEVNEYCHAKRKAIELTDNDGNNLTPAISVTFVRPTRSQQEEAPLAEPPGISPSTEEKTE